MSGISKFNHSLQGRICPPPSLFSTKRERRWACQRCSFRALEGGSRPWAPTLSPHVGFDFNAAGPRAYHAPVIRHFLRGSLLYPRRMSCNCLQVLMRVGGEDSAFGLYRTGVTHTHMQTHIHTYTHACMHAYIYIYIYTHTRVQTHRSTHTHPYRHTGAQMLLGDHP